MTLKPLLLAALLALPLAGWAADPARAVDPWVREAPANSQVLAAYITLENPGATPLHLVSVTSPLFSKVELHQTINKDGMAMMESVAHMAVPAAGKVVMAPGGLHVMLIGPTRPLHNGDKVPLVLTFAGAGTQSVEAVVRPGGSGHEPMDHGTQHKH